jgi:hypothetical protein
MNSDTSKGIPNEVRTSAASFITGRSESEPIIIATRGVATKRFVKVYIIKSLTTLIELIETSFNGVQKVQSSNIIRHFLNTARHNELPNFSVICTNKYHLNSVIGASAPILCTHK